MESQNIKLTAGELRRILENVDDDRPIGVLFQTLGEPSSEGVITVSSAFNFSTDPSLREGESCYFILAGSVDPDA